MPFDDLELEFEDEEESKKKKQDAVNVDVDLEFQSPTGIARPVSARPAAPSPRPESAMKPQAPSSPRSVGVVKNLDDARPSVSMGKKAQTEPKILGSSALKLEQNIEMESQEVVELREKLRKVELDSEVRVQVAEFKTEFLSEMLSDMKLMEHQVGQLLNRIHAKHPDMRNEVLMIKKILADFNLKKRK